MRFKTLTLTNFKSFLGEHQFQLDRPPGLYHVRGVNLVEPASGSNGAAKSTLFVEAPYWCLTGKTTRNQRPGATIEPWKTTKQTTSVELVLEINSVEHTITRSRKPNGLFLDGKVVDQSVITKLIPISDQAILRTFLICQTGTMFLDLRPEHQSDLFTELLHLDTWIEASARATDQAKQYTKQASKVRDETFFLDGNLAELKNQIEQAETRQKAFEAEQVKIIEQAHQDLLEAESALAAHLQNAPETTVDSAQAADTFAAIQTEERALVRLQALIKGLQEKQALGFERLGVLKNGIASDDSGIKDCKLALSQDDLTCEMCEQPVSKAHLEKRLAQLQTQVAYKCIDRDAQQSLLETYDKEIPKHQKAAILLQEKIQQLKLAGREAQLAQAELDSQRRALEKEVASCQKAFSQESARRNPFIPQLMQLIDNEKEITESLLSKQKLLQTLEKAVIDTTCWVNGFKEIRLNRIDETLLELEAAATRHVAALGLADWGMEFKTERETQSGSVNHKFTTLIYPPNMEAIPWESYSGGEGQRLQLGCTLGLSEVLLAGCGLLTNIMVLDEPTHHLSATGIDDLLEHLHEIALEQQQAIYLIDHTNLQSGSIDGTILIQKDATGSHIRE